MGPKLFLNTTPCQFTESKTKNAINYINQLDASRCEPNSENGVHHMTIILNNNNLIEGRQWNIRLKSDNRSRNVAILSSDKKRARFNSANNFIGYCASIEKPDYLIDTLVVCNNTIRNTDVIRIIDTFHNNRINLKTIGIEKCKFTVMFDEVDVSSNLTNACSFIDNCNTYECIDSIHLITATPYKKFWKKINSCGIKQLTNLKSKMPEALSPNKLIDDYRQLKEHNITYTEFPSEGSKYIKDVYTKHIQNKEYVKRIFAPPSSFTDEHNTVKKFFLNNNFIVIVINGKGKEIYFNKDESITINNFNNKYFNKINDVPMYKTLTKLDKLYSNTNIVITGYNCIERGITFQTDGFNFTDMIIPPIKDIPSCVQILGRANGGKKYVKKHNIYIKKNIYERVDKCIEFALELIKSNPVEITENDFREKTNKEKDMIRWEIPILIELDEEKYNFITEKSGKRFRRERALSLFREHNINIEGYDPVMWNQPIHDKAYTKNIMPLLNAIRNNEKCCLLHKKDKEKNKKMYSVYFDHKNYNVILIKYNGDLIV